MASNRPAKNILQIESPQNSLSELGKINTPEFEKRLRRILDDQIRRIGIGPSPFAVKANSKYGVKRFRRAETREQFQKRREAFLSHAVNFCRYAISLLPPKDAHAYRLKLVSALNEGDQDVR